MPTATFDKVQTYTVPSNTTEFTFSTISQSYSHLYLSMHIKNTSGGAGMDYYLRFNGDSGANYATTKAGFLPNNTRQSNRVNDATGMQLFYTAAGSSSNGWSVGHVWIPFYTSSMYKNIQARGSEPIAETGMSTSFWNSTAAISSITVYASATNAIGAGSTVTIYGLLKA